MGIKATSFAYFLLCFAFGKSVENLFFQMGLELLKVLFWSVYNFSGCHKLEENKQRDERKFM